MLTAAPEDAEQMVQDYWQMREQRMEQARWVVPDLLGYLRQEIATMSLDVEVKIIEP